MAETLVDTLTSTEELRSDIINRMIRGVTYYSSSPHVAQLSIILWDNYCEKTTLSKKSMLCAAAACVVMATELSGVPSIDPDIIANIFNNPKTPLTEIVFFAAARNEFYNAYTENSNSTPEYAKDFDIKSYPIVCYAHGDSDYVQFDPSQYISREELDNAYTLIEKITENEIVDTSYSILKTENMSLFHETVAHHIYQLYPDREEEQRLGVYISLICMIESTEYTDLSPVVLASKISALVDLCVISSNSYKIRQIITSDEILTRIYSQWTNFRLKKHIMLAEYLHYHFGMDIKKINDKFVCPKHLLEAMESVDLKSTLLSTQPMKKETSIYYRVPVLSYSDFRNMYSLTNKIGQGTFGSIWEIGNSKESSRIVVKQIYEDRASAYREISAYANLNHPSIITVSGCSVSDNHKNFYLALEKMEMTLSKYFHSHVSEHATIPYYKRRSCIKQLVSGVEHMHSRNIAHRDLTASNILIRFERGEPVLKIADFGTAKHMVHGETFDSRYNTHQVCGANYRAVEIWIGQAYGKSADIWSIGCLLYLMMKRHNLFSIVGFKSYLVELVNQLGEPDTTTEICPVSSAKIDIEYKNSFTTSFSRWYHHNNIAKVIKEDLELERAKGASKLELMKRNDPHMAEIISWCLDYTPTKRPTASDILAVVTEIMQ